MTEFQGLVVIVLLTTMAVGQETKSQSTQDKTTMHLKRTSGDACPKRIHKYLCEVDVEWLEQQELSHDKNKEHPPIIVDPAIGAIIFKSAHRPFRVKSYTEIDCHVPYAPNGSLQPFLSPPGTDYRNRHPTDVADGNSSTHCFKATIERQDHTIVDPHIYVGGKPHPHPHH
jgi:hypothetical protein